MAASARGLISPALRTAPPFRRNLRRDPARLPVVRRSLQDRDGERSAAHGRPTRELDSLDND